MLPPLLVALLFVATDCKKDPAPVEDDDGVRCCFFVPYDGLNGQTINEKQCMPDLVCPGAGDKDTKDVCQPLACKAGASNPYGQLGPGGASVVSSDCSFDAQRSEVIKDGCPVDDRGGGGGTDQSEPPPGDGSGADSTGR